jgi:hypothetical protein
MQPLLDGVEEPRVDAMVEAVVAYPVTAGEGAGRPAPRRSRRLEQDARTARFVG